MDQLVSNHCRISEDAIETGVLAVAALVVLEEFSDYTEQLLEDSLPLFMQFYAKYVKPMLSDSKKRVYALCFEEVIAWVR